MARNQGRVRASKNVETEGYFRKKTGIGNIVPIG